MNFNLALICSDGRFADARALCASCSSLYPCGRSHHLDSGALGAVINLWGSKDISLGPATPAQIGETKDT